MLPLPAQVSSGPQNQEHEYDGAHVAPGLLIFVKVMKFDFGVFCQPQKRRPVYVIAVSALTVRGQGGFLCGRRLGLGGRMR